MRVIPCLLLALHLVALPASAVDWMAATRITDLAATWDDILECPAPGLVGGPEPGLDTATLLDFFLGRKAFRTPLTPAAGLGPHFNDVSCASCHSTPVIGGRGLDVPRQGISVHAPSVTDHNAMGLRRHAIEGFTQEVAEGRVGHLRTPALFGIGRLDSIPNAVLEASQDPDDRDGNGIRGVVNRRGAGLGTCRFGAKANELDLLHFVAGALRDEMGVTSPQHRNQAPDGDAVPDPEVPVSFVAHLDAYVRHLARPPLGPQTQAAIAGAQVFQSAGCPGCHKPQLADVQGAYTDLLLHDLGPGLDNGLRDGLASGSQWRTPALWGFTLRAKYLHDERAADLEQVLANHQGEAKTASGRYFQLPAPAKAQLLAFLRSL
jgi:CxxC motif-containing protein (DUF1111 family)